MNALGKVIKTLMVNEIDANYLQTPISKRKIQKPIKAEKQIVYCCKCGIELKNEFSYYGKKKICLSCKAIYKVKRKKEKKPYVKIVYKKRGN